LWVAAPVKVAGAAVELEWLSPSLPVEVGDEVVMAAAAEDPVDAMTEDAIVEESPSWLPDVETVEVAWAAAALLMTDEATATVVVLFEPPFSELGSAAYTASAPRMKGRRILEDSMLMVESARVWTKVALEVMKSRVPETVDVADDELEMSEGGTLLIDQIRQGNARGNMVNSQRKHEYWDICLGIVPEHLENVLHSSLVGYARKKLQSLFKCRYIRIGMQTPRKREENLHEDAIGFSTDCFTVR